MSGDEYADYPGGENFESWQDHEWPVHCGVAATYLGEVGERELALVVDTDLETFLREHAVDPDGPPIVPEMVPPYASPEGEAFESTIHHFRCSNCGWDLVLWDAA